jgi:phospholipid/cholesterol/gamma-HCH transport system ATP-binding protein
VSDAPVIVCEGVGKRFEDAWILREVDLVVRPGEILGIIGPGGHGKSVLMRLLAGLLTPDEGRVCVDGRDLATLSALELSEVRANYGYLFQNYALFDFMTVADNVAFPLRQLANDEEAMVMAAVRKRLDEVNLGHALPLYPRELSGGMKKRVGLARATVAHPRIVLYDDPTAGLDPVTSSKIFELLQSVHRVGSRDGRPCASVVVSHDIDRMRRVCQRYVMVYEGLVRFDGPESEMEGAPAIVRDFFFGATEKEVGYA